MATPIFPIGLPPTSTPTRRDGRRISRKQWRRQNARAVRKGRRWIRFMTAEYIQARDPALGNAFAFGLGMMAITEKRIRHVTYADFVRTLPA